MDRLFAATAGRALEEAQTQAEIVLSALRQEAVLDGKFLLAHAEHLLACCREIADSRTAPARG